MKKNNLFFAVIVFSFVLYIFIFYILAENIENWFYDLKSCYKVMEFNWFVIEHINVFFYLFLFFLMFFSLVKMLYILSYKIGTLKEIYKNIQILKLKQYKNVIIIDYPYKVAFNFLNKIIISNKILKNLNKKQKKAIFLHEKGHLNSLDSYKMLILDILLSIFPEKLKEKLFKAFILFAEISADYTAKKVVGKKILANTLLNVVSKNSYYPFMNNFTKERLYYLLENKKVKIPKYIWLIYFILAFLIFLLVYYKTCLCGVM